MRIGYDFDGVITAGLMPDRHGIIITGRSWRDSEYVYSFLRKKAITCPVYFNPTTEIIHDWQDSAEWKAEMCDRLNIELFYEDDYKQARLIESLSNVEVMHYDSEAL